MNGKPTLYADDLDEAGKWWGALEALSLILPRPDGDSFTYPDPPEWWDSSWGGAAALALGHPDSVVSWRMHLEAIWRAMGIWEDNE